MFKNRIGGNNLEPSYLVLNGGNLSHINGMQTLILQGLVCVNIDLLYHMLVFDHLFLLEHNPGCLSNGRSWWYSPNSVQLTEVISGLLSVLISCQD